MHAMPVKLAVAVQDIVAIAPHLFVTYWNNWSSILCHWAALCMTQVTCFMRGAEELFAAMANTGMLAHKKGICLGAQHQTAVNKLYA